MIISIKGVDIDVLEESKGIRLKTSNDNVSFAKQSWLTLEPLIVKNYEIVSAALPEVDENIIDRSVRSQLIISIVLSHLCLYNGWRHQHAKEKDRDLTFIEKDLEHPMTYDIVTHLLKRKYPKDFRVRCANFFGITLERYRIYEEGRKLQMDR